MSLADDASVCPLLSAKKAFKPVEAKGWGDSFMTKGITEGMFMIVLESITVLLKSFFAHGGIW